VLSQPNTGIVGITKAAFVRDIYLFTVFHELAHSVDYHLGIVPAGSTVDHFRGVHYPSENVNEYTAETYARFILVPTEFVAQEIYLWAETKSNACSQRLINVLMEYTGFSAGSSLLADHLRTHSEGGAGRVQKNPTPDFGPRLS